MGSPDVDLSDIAARTPLRVDQVEEAVLIEANPAMRGDRIRGFDECNIVALRRLGKGHQNPLPVNLRAEDIKACHLFGVIGPMQGIKQLDSKLCPKPQDQEPIAVCAVPIPTSPLVRDGQVFQHVGLLLHGGLLEIEAFAQDAWKAAKPGRILEPFAVIEGPVTLGSAARISTVFVFEDPPTKP